jgi:hypothetical protein
MADEEVGLVAEPDHFMDEVEGFKRTTSRSSES